MRHPARRGAAAGRDRDPPERDAGGRHRPARRHRHDPSEYYTHLAACRKLPTTSQPSPEQFERLYLDAAAAGDEVLGIFLSDALSGTGQCARLAADLANVDNVVFVNTENVCLGQSLLVRLAVQLRDAGKTITQIAADLEKAKQHLHLVAAVDDLKYLRKGGRLSAAAAVAGGMLGIKPILAVMEGLSFS